MSNLQVELGISIPFWLHGTFVQVVGHRQADLYGGRAQLFTPAEALKIGLVDEV